MRIVIAGYVGAGSVVGIGLAALALTFNEVMLVRSFNGVRDAGCGIEGNGNGAACLGNSHRGIAVAVRGFNDYGPGVQHLYRHENEDITVVPEFLTINVVDMQPEINITLV